MTLYYADAEIPDGLNRAYKVRAFWDKNQGQHGVDVILVGSDAITRRWEEPQYVSSRAAALVRFAAVVKRVTKRVTKQVYG